MNDDSLFSTKKNENLLLSSRTNLLYDHKKSIRKIYGELKVARDLLKSICELRTSQKLKENFTEIFTKFIYSVRYLDYQGLLQLFYRAQSICKTGR